MESPHSAPKSPRGFLSVARFRRALAQQRGKTILHAVADRSHQKRDNRDPRGTGKQG
jgi:hypothetical protein